MWRYAAREVHKPQMKGRKTPRVKEVSVMLLTCRVRQDILQPVCYYGTYPHTFKHDLLSWDSEGDTRWRGNSRDGSTPSAPQSARQHCDSHHCNSPSSTG